MLGYEYNLSICSCNIKALEVLILMTISTNSGYKNEVETFSKANTQLYSVHKMCTNLGIGIASSHERNIELIRFVGTLVQIYMYQKNR